MTIKLGINGFGRIGRSIVRIMVENPDTYGKAFELLEINARGSIDLHYHLLKYDSVHGRFSGKVEKKDGCLIINGKKIHVHREHHPEDIDWSGIDVVMECTGVFKDLESCTKHLKGGARKVMISAPAKDQEIKTIVYGVNNDILTDDDKIISIGSCTTNCLAPIADVLNKSIGIESGFVTTVHAYTNDQNIADARHSDLRRARAAALSMIPTSTGAAKAIGNVIPELNGKLDGVAIRVPTPNVSMIDLCFNAGCKVTATEINNIIKEKSEGELKGIISYCDEPLVSVDFNHTPYSAVFDASGTKVVNDNFVRIAAWYDNEWGFATRMLDVAKLIG